MAYLYKYKKVDKYLLATLLNQELYFASPDQLNDPLDCRISIVDSLKSALESPDPDDRTEQHQVYLESIRGMSTWDKMDNDVESSGVLSLSSNPENSVMWSHYADSHKGVCLGFDFPENWHQLDDNEMIGIAPVLYADENPFIAFFTDIINHFLETTETPEWKSVWMPAMAFAYGTKGKDWWYEKEHRVIRKTSGNVAFDLSYLKEIIFGMETTQEDKALVHKILSLSGYANVTIKHIHKDPDSCGIRLVED